MSYKLLIDGQLVEGSQSLPVINPATGKVFATCARANEAQALDAIAAAKRAFGPWSALSHADRQRHLDAFADGIEDRQAEFTELLTKEQGKPLAEAGYEVAGSIAILRHFAGVELPLKTLRESEEGKILEQHVPLGVVAAITPWNFPLSILMLKVGPCLSTGNTMVAKPAPTTPLTTALLGEIAVETLPAGVFNVIIDDNDLGPLLSAHPDIAKVSFTGSTATGRRVMESAAGTLKRLTLELGGKDAAIILDDVDPKAIAPRIFSAATFNAGQVCLAAKRIYAPRASYDALCEELAMLARSAVVDDGMNPGTQIGPLQNRQQYDKVLGFIEEAGRAGTIVAGGKAIERDGYFVQPTIVRDLPDDAPLVQEEQFGPVVPVLAYDTVDEVIEKANASPYGLGGTIWTNDVDRGIAIATRIETGTIWINKHLDLPLDVPFGGAKQSGMGQESGLEGLKEFTQTKIINAAVSF